MSRRKPARPPAPTPSTHPDRGATPGGGRRNTKQAGADATTRYASPFAFDLRAVALFRVLLALTLLLDQAERLAHWGAFYSADALVSLAEARDWYADTLWSVYWVTDHPLWPVALEALRLAATVALLLGVRARLAALVLFALVTSVVARNPLIHHGGDDLLLATTFFAAFLPLGARWSLEHRRFGGTAQTRTRSAATPARTPTGSTPSDNADETTTRSAATLAYTVQALLVYFMAGIHKTGAEWWSTGTALSMALHLETYITELGRLWRSWDWLLRPMTPMVLAIELLAPLAALVPRWWCRAAAVAALAALQVGIAASLELGLFQWIALVALVPLLPPPAVDAACAWWDSREQPRSAWVRDARARAARIVARVWPRAAGEIAPAGSLSARPLAADDGRRDAGAAGAVGAGGGRRKRATAAAGRGRAPAPPARRRGAFLRAADALCFGRGGADPTTLGRPARIVVLTALAAVLAWNAATHPMLYGRVDLRPAVAPVVAVFNLFQGWAVYSPQPPVMDAWHALPALGRDGRRVDLVTGGPLNFETPRNGPEHYGSHRWRKMIDNAVLQGQNRRLLEWHCRDERWRYVEFWLFMRPNEGTAATADGRYVAERDAAMHCGAGGRAEVDAFVADLEAQADAINTAALGDRPTAPAPPAPEP